MAENQKAYSQDQRLKWRVKWNLTRTGFPKRFGRNETTRTHRRNTVADGQIASNVVWMKRRLKMEDSNGGLEWRFR